MNGTTVNPYVKLLIYVLIYVSVYVNEPLLLIEIFAVYQFSVDTVLDKIVVRRIFVSGYGQL